MAWYVSRTLSLREIDFRVEGEDPWNAYALDDGVLGEHARWWLKLQLKHQRWPWRPWKIQPERTISEVRMYPRRRPTAAEWIAARLLTALALWRVLR